jgi:hypothetical protein
MSAGPRVWRLALAEKLKWIADAAGMDEDVLKFPEQDLDREESPGYDSGYGDLEAERSWRETLQKLAQFSKGDYSAARIQAVQDLSDIAESYLTDMASVALGWSLTRDLVECNGSLPSHAHEAGIELAIRLAQNHHDSLGKIRQDLLDFLLSVPQICVSSRHFKLLIALYDFGKSYSDNSLHVGFLFLRWMQMDVISVEDVVKFLINLFKHHGHCLADDLGHALIREFMTRRDVELVKRIAAVDSFVRHARDEVLHSNHVMSQLVSALCLGMNLSGNQSWCAMRTLLERRVGKLAFHHLFSILEQTDRYRDGSIRGAIFFVGMSCWGSQRISTLECPFSWALSCLVTPSKSTIEDVVYEVLLCIRRLIRKYKGDMGSEWRLVNSLVCNCVNFAVDYFPSKGFVEVLGQIINDLCLAFCDEKSRFTSYECVKDFCSCLHFIEPSNQERILDFWFGKRWNRNSRWLDELSLLFSSFCLEQSNVELWSLFLARLQDPIKSHNQRFIPDFLNACVLPNRDAWVRFCLCPAFQKSANVQSQAISILSICGSYIIRNFQPDQFEPVLNIFIACLDRAKSPSFIEAICALLKLIPVVSNVFAVRQLLRILAHLLHHKSPFVRFEISRALVSLDIGCTSSHIQIARKMTLHKLGTEGDTVDMSFFLDQFCSAIQREQSSRIMRFLIEACNRFLSNGFCQAFPEFPKKLFRIVIAKLQSLAKDGLPRSDSSLPSKRVRFEGVSDFSADQHIVMCIDCTALLLSLCAVPSISKCRSTSSEALELVLNLLNCFRSRFYSSNLAEGYGEVFYKILLETLTFVTILHSELLCSLWKRFLGAIQQFFDVITSVPCFLIHTSQIFQSFSWIAFSKRIPISEACILESFNLMTLSDLSSKSPSFLRTLLLLYTVMPSKSRFHLGLRLLKLFRTSSYLEAIKEFLSVDYPDHFDDVSEFSYSGSIGSRCIFWATEKSLVRFSPIDGAIKQVKIAPAECSSCTIFRNDQSQLSSELFKENCSIYDGRGEGRLRDSQRLTPFGCDSISCFIDKSGVWDGRAGFVQLSTDNLALIRALERSPFRESIRVGVTYMSSFQSSMLECLSNSFGSSGFNDVSVFLVETQSNSFWIR